MRVVHAFAWRVPCLGEASLLCVDHDVWLIRYDVLYDQIVHVFHRSALRPIGSNVMVYDQ